MQRSGLQMRTPTQAAEGKLPDGQEPAAVDVDYIATSDLQPLESSTLSDQLQVLQEQSIAAIHTHTDISVLRHSIVADSSLSVGG